MSSFARRACKVTSRHIVPLLVFGRCRERLAQTEAALDICIEPDELSSLDRFRSRRQTLFGDEFEHMIRAHAKAGADHEFIVTAFWRTVFSVITVDGAVVFAAVKPGAVDEAERKYRAKFGRK